MNEIALKYGCNPNQKPACIRMADGSDLPVTVLNGRPGYINFLDALNSWQLVKELKEATGLCAAASFKHVSPTSAAVGRPLPESLKKVTITSDITFIGHDAFSGLTSLEEISVPHSVTTLYWGAFENTTAKYELTNTITTISGINSWNGTIYYAATNGHFGKGIFGHLELSDSVTSIDYDAFRGCSSLTSITIPDCVTSIGNSAFSGCSSLTSVTIGNGVTSISNWAFSGCSSLTSVTIPDSVMSIGDRAFYECSSLYVIYNNSDLNFTIGSSDYGNIAYYAKLIIDKNGNKTYRDESSGFEYIDTADGFRFMKENGTYTLIAYLGAEDTVTLPTDINGNSYTVYRMSGVRNVIIPNGVTRIGSSAFSSCSSLTSITIPEGVTSIGQMAFYKCSSLESITIPDSVTYIGGSAFSGCSSLTSITIPDSVTSIGGFSGCSSLTSVTIGNGVTSIGSNAFYSCDKLVEEQILLPNELSETVRNIFNLDLDLKRAKMPYCLKTALDSCDNWNVLDMKYNI